MPEGGTFPMSAAGPLIRAEEIHRRFCLARSAAKRTRLVAFVVELAAYVLLLVLLLRSRVTWLPSFLQHRGEWLPLLVWAFILIDVVLRSFTASLRRFAQQCRRVSLRAFIEGADVEGAVAAIAFGETPGSIRLLGWKAPSISLQKYYDPKSETSSDRLRELYLENSFYSWRLLRIEAKALAFATGMIVVFVLILLYRLAGNGELTAVTRELALEALCTVVLVYVSARVVESTVRAFSLSSAFHRLFLAMVGDTTGSSLPMLADEYDLERSEGIDPPTIAYRLLEPSLAREWAEIRKAVIGR
jgi:hypothetical protein